MANKANESNKDKASKADPADGAKAPEAPGSVDASKTDAPTTEAKGKDAPPEENEKEQAERAAALEKAMEKANKAAGRIAADWARQDRSLKTWMIDMGNRCHAWLIAVVALGTPYSVAMSQLVAWLIATTGENKTADVTRCVKLYFASLVFGSDRFGRVSIRGQKELATLLTGATDEQTGATVYALDAKTADMAKAVFAFCCGDDKTAKDGIDRSKDGCVIGDHIAKLVAILKTGRDPLATETEEAKKEREVKEKAEKDKAAAEKKSKEAANGTVGGQGGKGQEETAAASPPAAAPKLDVKPAVAGGQLVKLLTEHDEGAAMVLHNAAKATEFSATMVEAILTAFSEAGRIADLRHISAVAGREVRLALIMEKDKVGRKEALKTMEQQDARRAG